MRTKKRREPKFVTRKYSRAYMLKYGDVYIEDLLKGTDGEWICEDNHSTEKAVMRCPYCTEYYRRMDELNETFDERGNRIEK